MKRRDWLKSAAASSTLLASSAVATSTATLAVAKTVAESNPIAKDIHATIAELTGGQSVQQDNRVSLMVQEQAQNGAVVPVGVASDIPQTQHLYILVSDHQQTLAADMAVNGALIYPSLSTHLQLVKPANITALVKSDNGWFSATAKIASLGEFCEKKG